MTWAELCNDPLLKNLPYKIQDEKKGLYFDKGANEFWVCDISGKLWFYNQSGEMNRSEIIENFPQNILG